ncbi:histone-lysine N-methyltransferase 2D-like isoform X6 [Cimex lectularius]|uniref:Histone-lysine N-methyltransferase n=1 Tax=Cimex lectularius TaxID=79782 RepID=A0A8I6TLN2_CIMLE|nr:histone-lysine N-methyltransferase 2D-like isoform X6 [Cimex lectularius]
MDETCGDAEGKAGGGGGIEEDMEVGECSEEEEDEEEDIDLGSSPITDQSTVMMSMTSPVFAHTAPTAYEGLASPLRVVSGAALTGGKPVVGIKRGPGRPRSRGGGATPVVRTKKVVGPKLKRWKGHVCRLLVSGVYGINNGKQPGEGEDESSSPVHPSTPVDPVKTPIFVDEPLFDETWPGKVCVLCNLTEHSQLGQGKMCRVECTVEELPKELPKELLMSPPETPPLDSTSPRQPFQNRRQKGASKFRNAGGGGQEPVDELSLVGHIDIPEPTAIVDSGYIYVHEWCAMWCTGVTRKGISSFNNLPAGVMAAVSRRCYHCSRYGAGSPCIIPSCNKHFHTPCAAAAATFQHPKTLTLICSQHIDHISKTPSLSDVECQSCHSLGNVNNLVMCSMCGSHHHGICIGNALQPGLRAGWQCAECRICQLCRQSEDTNRMLVCDSCDKAYHPSCVRPAMSSVPKVGWKCKRCRLCSDCGARTPGGGLSSRWHSNYTVCDSCYQQRNKGFSCPVCHKAYRAAALREMVRCSQCHRFVHGTCDKEADFVSYQRKKEAHPDYEYICLSCKNNSTVHYMKRKDSTEEAVMDSSLSASQESLMVNEDIDLDSEKSDDGPLRVTIGLGKGKPFCASKLAKKRLGLGVGPGRPKGSGKMSSLTSSLSHYQKRLRFADFGRKRGAKSKMRGLFGYPGLGLQRPLPDSSVKSEEEPGVENKLVLCSSKDRFVLGQDICVMCGSLGIEQEACLIACSQCGQCYHPYCVSVKVTKVMLQRGWRCLDCTICEGCGQRNDEARLILCDDCDISYHIYCMDPPLGSVPTGGWKCRWCAHCQTCGASSPGVNSDWQSNFSQCGACASRTTCPACLELYTDGDLIIKCITCERWLHCFCDTINTEQEAEACCAQGYTCVLCRPSNVALVLPATPVRVPSPEYTPDGKSSNDYYVDGICLSECGLQHIKNLSLENNNQPVRRKRPGFKRPQDNDILGGLDSINDPDNENNSNTVYKDGMIWGSKDSGPVLSPPEGFSLYTKESGVVVLKRKKQRNLQKLGIGGFSAVKMRSSRFKDDEEGSTHPFAEDKPRRKPRCNKKRSKLAETYPSYLQEAFFGRELLDITKESTQELESSSDDSDEGKSNKVSHDKTITLSQVMAEVKAKQEKISDKNEDFDPSNSSKISVKEEDVSDSEGLKDILHLSDNLLPNDLVNTIMNERDGIKTENLIGGSSNQHDSQNQKDELSEILGPHFSIESMVRETGLPNMDSKDVEEIFKGVLTDESQESQSSGAFPARGPTPGTPSHPQMSPQQGTLQSGMHSRTPNSLTPSVHTNLSSPIGFPSVSPYNSEYSNSPQFSPEGSPWGGDDNRTSHKMEADEPLGQHATMAPVLYANINHSEWKKEYPSWSDRFKQILKKWRTLPAEKKAPFVQQAKENRSLRIKKTQQIGKELADEDAPNGKQASSGKSFEVCPPSKIPTSGDRNSPYPATPPSPEQKLVSTASNTSPLHSPSTQETFPTTIPSHPSTIQYIPLNTPGIRATFHIIPTSIVTTTETPVTRAIQYQYERSTIHYPPTNVVIQSVPPLIMTSTTSGQSTDSKNLIQIIPTKTSTVSTVITQPSVRSQVQFIQTVKTVHSTSESESRTTNTICSPLSDQHIRVLTPSEIMRTLPSLGQETYDTPPSTEQDKTQVNKSTREAEQERQWKHIQAMRQQQLHSQARNQVTRVHRQISGDGTTIVQYPETSNTQSHLTPQQLQVATPQEPITNIALASPRGPPQQFTSPPGIKTARGLTPPGAAPLFPRMIGIRPPVNSPFSTPRQSTPEEMNRQLRDLLQRHQIKQEATPDSGQTAVAAAQIRQPIAQVRPQSIPQQAIHGVDGRVRLLLQHQRAAFPGSQVRPATRLDQFNLVQRPQQFPQNAATPTTIIRPTHQIIAEQRIQQQTVEQRIQGTRDGEEIPDVVTAELEKLEQEGGSIAEVEAVSAIFGDLAEDDDELLAEMGADFNILEYADPELDNISGGEKTNILDDLEAEVVKKKQSPVIPNESKDTPIRQEENKTLVKANPILTQTQPVSRTPPGQPTPSPTNSIVAPLTPQASIPRQQTKTVNKTFSAQFATPPAPLPRMQVLQSQSPRPQLTTSTNIVGNQGQNFIPIPAPPPPYPGPPPPYPGQLQSGIRAGAPKVPRPPLAPTAGTSLPQRRSLLLQEQPLLLEDLLEEEKREQEQQSVTPGSGSGASLLSDADFEMLTADVLGTNSRVSSPPHCNQNVQLLNIPVQPAPPAPPECIVTEQDRQTQMQYEQWLQTNNIVLTQQLKYYESEVQKLRKVRKSLNSKQRQLRKNGNELTQKDALELQRVTVEQTGLQKHLEAARKQSRTHSIIIQEYQNKQDQKNGGGTSTLAGSAPHSVGSASPQSPSNMMSPGVSTQSALPSPQTAASPLHHSPRIGTPQSQSGDDKSENSGMASPRSTALAPTPPSPHQFQIRHPGMVPRFARSPEGTLRPRIVSLQSHQVAGTTAISYSSPRGFTTSPQPVMSPNLSQQATGQTIRIQSIQGLTQQQQQLLLQKQQLQQQKQQLLQQQQELQEVGNMTRSQIDGNIQRQVLLRQGILQDDLTNQQQLILQRQQQLVQQNRQLIIGQGKIGQFRQIVQQNQPTFSQTSQMQNTNNMNQTFVSGSSMPPSPIINQSPSPITSTMNNVQQYNPSSSPMHPQSPMISQFHSSSSPMPHQSPRVQNYQTASSPMTPQSPMVYSGLQTPTSPMPQFNQPNSPMPPHSPRVQQQYGQPPSSPMSSSQSSMIQPQYVHRPNSPMVPMGSPMPIRRPSSTGGSVGNSPATERPQSVENPRTPQEQEGNGAGGGGNPYNPHNPIPLPPEIGRIGYVKLGLRGGSPMWSDKAMPRKPLLKGKVGQSLAGTSTNTEDSKSKINSPINKVPSLVCVDYNDFDEESRTPPMTPPTKPASIKKSDVGAVKTRQSEDTDSEATVYEDIVLVESCKETNLEVEELQSALADNVMSTVVSMPMNIDPSHMMNDSDILDDCLVSSTDLVVLDVDNGNNDILIIDSNISDSLKVDDDMIEFDEDMPSPPHGRKRMVGKVLPGEPIKVEEKRTSDTPDSPDDDLQNESPEIIHNELDSVSTPVEEKSEPFKTIEEVKIKKPEIIKISDNLQSSEHDRVISTIQPNVVVSRNSVTFTPVSTQKSIPICSERRLSIQQATVASLVQGAVNAAAKFAAETQNFQKTNSSIESIQASSNSVVTSHFSRPVNVNVSTPSVRTSTTSYLNQVLFGTKSDNQESNDKKDLQNFKKDQQPSGAIKAVVDPKTFQHENGSNMKLMDNNRLAELLNKNDGTNLKDKEKLWNMTVKRDVTKTKIENCNDVEDNSMKQKKLNEQFEMQKFTNEHNELQKKTAIRLNIIENKVDTSEKNDVKTVDRLKLIQSSENMNCNKTENVILPSVSSSILEAQLTTSMLRSENSNPQYFYAIVNHNVPKEIKKEDRNMNDDLRVEGLAAHLQRTIKNEELKNENEINKNARMPPHMNLKHGSIYVPAKIKSDNLGGAPQYKLVHTQQSAIESANDLANKEINHYINKMRDANSMNAQSMKSDTGSGISHKLSVLDKEKIMSNDLLQQRIVSSSEISQLLDKDTHHVNLGSAKPAQKEEPKKFVSLSNMLLSRRESDDKTTRLTVPRSSEDSQNVLLKQLLQNTACATTSPQTAPSLPIVPSLEDQLARPVPPTPSSLIPPVLNEPPKPQVIKEIIPTSKPTVQPPTPTEVQQRTPVPSCLDELLSPPHHPVIQSQTPTVIKREPLSFSQPSPIMTPNMEIKKETVPVNMPVAVEVKKEVMSSDEMLSPGFRMEPEQPGESPLQDLKKIKRRQYQQKRRQSLGKEAVGGTPKKRPRKSSKVEEDYDSFIDSLMHQLRQTPAMTICEPNLTYNFTGSPIVGSGDLSKVNSCTRLGELRGSYGQAYLPSENDHYNTLPFGDLPPRAPTTPSTQRGFYNEEFAPLKLHSTKDEFDDRKYDYNRDRDNDTPDTIISSSSPECVMPDFPTKFPGLQFVDSDGEEDKFKLSRFSPDIPIISPLIVRPKPIRFYSDMDKENEGPPSKKHCDNVTVTLTLSSQAADDVLSVLRNLANVLRIPVPVHYSITERSNTPHKLGLYKIKGKDGKEGGHIDIQSILNGNAKFCRHCDVVILNNIMRKKASEMPLVAKQGEEDLYFCSSNCYMQLALAHPQPIHSEKAASIVEHHGDISKKSRLDAICDSTIIKQDFKKEKPPNDISPYMSTRGAGKRDVKTIEKTIVPTAKKSPSRYRTWSNNNIPPPLNRHKTPSDKEMAEVLFKSGITVMPVKLEDDTRVCLFCHQIGDGVTDGPARLLNYDVNKWVHLNCALWSYEVYETTNGGLMNVESALQNGMTAHCAYCNTTGATLKCYKVRCSLVYHLPCAVKDQCVFYKNKTLHCNSHAQKNEKENELTTLSVMRRVYINRDEGRQVASVMHHSEQTNLLRVGSLIFLSVGQLLPHQLQAFHTKNYIYPIGYKILRMYWSMRNVNKRCKYLCSIHEVDSRPEFRIVVQERGEPDLELKDTTPKGVWLKILEPMAELRRSDNLVQLFTKFISGEDLFGLTEPAIVKVLESLPGVETLTDYKFKYGRNPLLELPLAINPTGCARSEGKPKGQGLWKRAHTQRTCSASSRPALAPSTPQSGEPSCPYSKQFVHSKSSQYKKMKQEWRNNVYLARSKIQGLGLYAARDLEKHTMVIEYIGEIIRTELAETREKQYEAKNRGIYMFRLDEERVVDATLSGGLARYINHSCSPNCVAETVEVERDLRIIIFTKRRISRGEELAYDYKFDIEDDQHKIPCMCGAPNCRKWMN